MYCIATQLNYVILYDIMHACIAATRNNLPHVATFYTARERMYVFSYRGSHDYLIFFHIYVIRHTSLPEPYETLMIDNIDL